MYSTSLLCYDGSAEGRNALKEGAEVALCMHAQVHMLAIIRGTLAVGVPEGVNEMAFRDEDSNADAVLREGVDWLRARGVDARGEIVFGNAIEQITLAVMSSTLIQVLDTTIVNVALPHMQGELGATSDQISWVLTNYLVAAAIFMPLTGYFADIVGRKRYLLVCIAGFVAASALCGLSRNLSVRCLIAWSFLWMLPLVLVLRGSRPGQASGAAPVAAE